MTDELCKCGHTEKQHNGPEGLGGAQCRLCPGDDDRSWRHPYTPRSNNERCERYAIALAESGAGEFWENLDTSERETWRDFAVAAMAVADAEIQSVARALGESRAFRESLRDLLDAETNRANDAIERERQADAFAAEIHSDLVSVVEENQSLRAELDESHRLVEVNRAAAREAEEAIERVRAALIDHSRDPHTEFLFAGVLAALDGGTAHG